jgi:dipeptidyl aminopeptidase/acylaminoacyl peptidase
MRFRLSIFSLVTALVPWPSIASAAPFTVKDLHALKRLADPQISPDGAWVLYQQTTIELGKSRNTDLFLVPASGGPALKLTSHARSDSRGRFSPDGRHIAFLSSRDGTPQVYIIALSGGEPRKVTSLSQGVQSYLWTGNDRLLVVADAHDDCALGEGNVDACTKEKVAKADTSVRVYDTLLYRHWDAWEDGLRTRLFVVHVATGASRALAGDSARDTPPFSLGGEDVGVAPDGSEVAFSRNDDPLGDQASSTNADLFVISTSDEAATPRKIAANPGYDAFPRYSPDGSMIAFRAQTRAGYESDRWRLMVQERKTGKTRTLTESFDRHVDEIAWSPDAKTIYFTAGDGTANPLFSVPAAGGTPRKLADGHLTQLSVAADGRRAVMALDSLTHPAEIVAVDLASGATARLTNVNEAALASFRLSKPESITYRGAAGKDVQGWVLKPANFDSTKKYPLVVLVHGGPQGVWSDSWSFRWNPQVFANAGFVVFAPNPRGSTGFGQAFIDDVNRDWGGKAYEDIMKGVDVVAARPYVDANRMVAAGASFGGYMVNWMCTQTKRFKAFVSHDGVYDLESMYGSTEEIWFTDWEFGGPPWKDRTDYDRFSPSRFIQNCATPTLVVHNDKDYRVPIDQGLQFFTALQKRGIPSKLVMFPEENHWVLKPENSVRWYEEVLGWLKRWVDE